MISMNDIETGSPVVIQTMHSGYPVSVTLSRNIFGDITITAQMVSGEDITIGTVVSETMVLNHHGLSEDSIMTIFEMSDLRAELLTSVLNTYTTTTTTTTTSTTTTLPSIVAIAQSTGTHTILLEAIDFAPS
jgi:hypothetical protein